MVSLKFGLTLREGGTSVAEQARRAEALGFDSVWVGEHVVWRHPVHDSLTLLAAAATATEKVRLGTAILLLSLKHPVLVCKAATTLDHISGGRMSLGIGIGGEFPKEFQAMGIPVNERGPRATEALRLIKRLWTEDSVTFQGRYFNVQDLALEPHPIQKPHPPILVGGRRRALRRTALYADGWMPYMYSPEIYREDLQKIAEIATDAGRDPSNIERTVWLPICVADNYDDAAVLASRSLGDLYDQSFDRIVRNYAVLGTPEECAARIQEYREAGAEHFILGPQAPDDRAREMPEVISREVVPLVRKEG